MYIKNIFNVKNYKGLPDNFKTTFEDFTYIIGDNAKNKTTIGSIPLWILTGYNMSGSNKEQVSNDNNDYANTLASMTIIDNDGKEHIITRCKGKDNFVMLDEIRTTQEVLTKFYKDVHSFICSYNPSYFRSLEPVKQKELLLRILPTISSDEAFNLLENEEKEILENPIADIKGFCKARRAEIKELKSDLDKITGKKSIYINIAIQEEDELKEFTKSQELKELEEEYEKIVLNGDNYISLEDLEKDIKKLEDKINKYIKVDLTELQERHKKETYNLKNVDSTTSTCPTCKQEIKNESLIKALTITYKKNVNTLAKKIDELKKETMELIEKRKIQVNTYKKLKTPEMQEKIGRINELKEQIKSLQNEKSEIDLYNNEINNRHNEIVNAKKQISLLNEEAFEISNKIELYNNQLKIANRLNLLMIQEQMKQVHQYLSNVTIEFSRVDEDTGEIVDDYIVKYNGRNYEKLSKSYKLRADMEIARLINKVTEINTPMFIDDVESITQINFDFSIQTILSIVVKHNELEVLYSYPEVLLRQRDSINKTISESNNLMQNVA